MHFDLTLPGSLETRKVHGQFYTQGNSHNNNNLQYLHNNLPTPQQLSQNAHYFYNRYAKLCLNNETHFKAPL